MKTKNGFRLRQLGKDYILTADGLEVVNFNRIITFNSTAAYLWQAIDGKEFDTETLANLLVAKYEVEASQALKDAEKTIDEWKKADIVA